MYITIYKYYIRKLCYTLNKYNILYTYIRPSRSEDVIRTSKPNNDAPTNTVPTSTPTSDRPVTNVDLEQYAFYRC